MRYGLALFMTACPIGMKTLAQRAEARGYDALWARNHRAIPTARAESCPWNESRTLPEADKDSVDALVALATAAGTTQRPKQGTASVPVPERNPSSAPSRRTPWMWLPADACISASGSAGWARRATRSGWTGSVGGTGRGSS